MITSLTGDPRKVYRKNLTDTAAHVLIDCERQEIKTLESMAVSCAASAAFTLIYNDGNEDFPIYNAYVMAANTTLFITDFPLYIGYLNGPNVSQTIKVQADTANRISVVAVTYDATPIQAIAPGGTGGQNVGWRGA